MKKKVAVWIVVVVVVLMVALVVIYTPNLVELMLRMHSVPQH
jgi:hypothetical protein